MRIGSRQATTTNTNPSYQPPTRTDSNFKDVSSIEHGSYPSVLPLLSSFRLRLRPRFSFSASTSPLPSLPLPPPPLPPSFITLHDEYGTIVLTSSRWHGSSPWPSPRSSSYDDRPRAQSRPTRGGPTPRPSHASTYAPSRLRTRRRASHTR